MAKGDVRGRKLGEWDAYASQPVDVSLKQVFDRVHETSSSARDWYWSSIRAKKRMSIFVVSLSLALLIGGAVLPIVSGVFADTDVRLLLTQFGVAALAFAGLAQAADRIFGWSSGWIRYITTATAMEDATRKFDLDWADYLLQKEGTIEAGDAHALFTLARAFEDEIFRLRSDETDKWATDFNAGMAMLQQLIRSQREAAQGQADAAQKRLQTEAASRKHGAIELSLDFGGAAVPTLVELDDGEPVEIEDLSWVAKEVAPGVHKLRVARKASPGRGRAKSVQVEPGAVAELALEVPA